MPAKLRLRPLHEDDWHKGFLTLLAQLTVVGEVSKSEFRERFQLIQDKQPDYYIAVIEDEENHKLAASATVFLEYKFIRGCGKTAHIEDVVVDKEYRGQKLGQRLIEALIAYADSQGCYKVILDCADSNIAFYEKSGFKKKEEQMVLYMKT